VSFLLAILDFSTQLAELYSLGMKIQLFRREFVNLIGQIGAGDGRTRIIGRYTMKTPGVDFNFEMCYIIWD